MSLDPSTTTSSKSRSIFARLAAPFSKGKGNISEFYIKPDDPWKSYFPGEIVKGTVVVTVVKPVRVTHLVVCLHGYAKVYKNSKAPGDKSGGGAGFLGPGKGRRAGEYLGNGFVSLFEDEVVLCGDGQLKKQEYRFSFELEFPSQGLPSSIDVSFF